MFCSKCGSNLAPGSAFCQVCGTAAPAASAPPAIPATGSAIPSAGAPVSPHWLPPATRAFAGFWLRLVACLIDGVLLGAVLGAVFVPILLLGGFGAALQSMAAHDHQPDPAAIFAFASSIALFVGASVLAGWLYYAYFESSEWQGTVGKKVMNLVVTDLAGNRVSFGRASGRYFARFITKLIPLGIGYILAGITEKKQALHDMIASCLVLRS
ncbi:MAG TPA: RDD family protein [Candidatus Bathyarchaeia archaeon]|nr:RDD family protein [Candidatus Bathyarchaeia archaeon]